MMSTARLISYFFFNSTASTEIYTLSLHDALPISGAGSGVVEEMHVADADRARSGMQRGGRRAELGRHAIGRQDRKSTRLNSSHSSISYAVFCLKKKKKKTPRR